MPTPVPGQHIFREKGASNGKQPPPRETPIGPQDGGAPGLLPCLAGSTLSTALLRNASTKSLKTPFSGFQNHHKWTNIIRNGRKLAFFSPKAAKRAPDLEPDRLKICWIFYIVAKIAKRTEKARGRNSCTIDNTPGRQRLQHRTTAARALLL